MSESLRFRLTSPLLLVLMTAGLVFIFAPLQNPVAMDDGLRHDAMGRLIAKEGLGVATWDRFLWTGYLGQHAVDPWFLSDVLYAPLSFLSPVRSMQTYAVVSVLFLLSAFLLALRRLRVQVLLAVGSAFFLILLNPYFFYRLLLARPYVLVMGVFLWVIAAVIGKKKTEIFVALTLATLLSHLFVFPLFSALFGGLWLVLRNETRDAKGVVLAAIGGTALGFLLHPHALGYIHYVSSVFFKIPFLQNIEKASEMTMSTSRVIEAALIALALLPSIIIEHRKSAGKPSGTEFVGWLVVIFGCVACVWPRGIDYLWPVAALFVPCFLSPRVHMGEGETPGTSNLRFFLVIFFLFLCSTVIFLATARGLSLSDEARSLTAYKEALAEVPSGAKVLNVDWHLFAPYVAVRPDLTYATGMDAAFTALQDPKASALLYDLVTPIFREKINTVTANEWLKNMTAEYPGDYLALDTARHAAMVEAFTTIGIKKVSKGNLVAVFKLK